MSRGCPPDLIKQGLHAGNWLKQVAPVVGGGGGGRPDLAQAGGKNPEQIPAALAKAVELITLKLAHVNALDADRLTLISIVLSPRRRTWVSC